MKIKFNVGDKMIKLHNAKIVVRVAFLENNKYCPQIFLDECLCEL